MIRTPVADRLASVSGAIRDSMHSQGITQAELARRLGMSQSTISRALRNPVAIGSGTLARITTALGTELQEGWSAGAGMLVRRHALVHIERFSAESLRELQLDPTKLQFLKPSEFEHFVADRLDRMGFDPTIVGQTKRKDGGIDIIAVPKIRTVAAQLIAVQVKHHTGNRKTGREVVDRLLAWKDTYFALGLLVTNTHFTEDARWLAAEERNKVFLRLREFEDIKRWLEDNFVADAEWRELPPCIVMAPGVVVELPKFPLRE
jgi:transcriptional regulator with XRE-family HTH domain